MVQEGEYVTVASGACTEVCFFSVERFFWPFPPLLRTPTDHERERLQSTIYVNAEETTGEKDACVHPY